MLFLVGLGLGDAKDITVKGLEIVKMAKRVYLEAYTSILTVGKDALEEFYGRDVILADRDMVESDSDSILQDSKNEDIAFLVVGDPFGHQDVEFEGFSCLPDTFHRQGFSGMNETKQATTHTDLVLRARKKGIQYRVVHNASILNAVGCCGLQLYNFGETVSVVFWTDTWRPHSFYDKIAANKSRGMHTLCLLDIKVKEQSIENLMRGKKVYEPPRYLTASLAAEQLVEIVKQKREEGEKDIVLAEDSLCVGLARVGADTQTLLTCTLEQMTSVDLGPPLHSLVIPGYMHPLEMEMLKQFALNDSVIEMIETLERNSEHSQS